MPLTFLRSLRVSRASALMLLFALASSSFAVEAATDQDKTATQSQIRQLKQDINKLEGWLKDAKGERSDLSSELKTHEKAMGQLQQQIREQEAELKELDQQIHSLEEKKKALNEASAEQKKSIEQQVRAAYMNGQGADRLKMLLSQSSPDALARLWAYQNRLQQARHDELFAYRTSLDKLRLVQQDLNDKRAKQVKAQEGMESRQKELAKVYADRRKTLAALNKQMANRENRLSSMQGDEKRLQTMLAQIEASLRAAKLSQTQGNFPSLKGKLALPIDGPIISRFGSAEGYVRSDGIIIGGPTGATVKAVSQGRVVFADWLRGFGLLLIIDHGQGYMSLYGHNETLLKDTGDWVQAGEAIATLGRSGGQQQSNLYFAIRRNGKATDPQPWFKHG
ncbi:murein hydrolase activator EnvC family protein [Pokkaliibacter sp. CJK22405]|uniref:murein hydrolase activator EnvC family protein n=1 Tax=Pokkaliibacter sp. CJK22405 TaxID=3384615 RepID=UPI0039850C36